MDVFYFICYTKGDRGRLSVIDLGYAVSYEKHDWVVTTPTDYNDRDDAIRAARALAQKYGLQYDMFNSRYDESTNEYLGEFE